MYFNEQRQKWTAQLYIDGKRHTRSAANEQGAVRLLAKLRKARDEGRDITTLTVEAFLTDWLARRKLDTRTNTYRGYESKVRVHLIPRVGGIRLEALTPAHVEAATRAVLAAGGSGQTAAHCRTVLANALHDAQRRGLVERNVASLAQPPRIERDERTALTMVETRGLAGQLAGHDWAALYALAYTIGLREGEVLALRWQDIDLEARTLRVARTVRRTKGAIDVYEEPKSRRSRRALPLTMELVALLRARQDRQRQQRKDNTTVWHLSDLVFTDAAGRSLSATQVLRELREVERAAKLPLVTFHDLRHSANSILAAAGVPAEVRAAILGHSSTRITDDIYTHVVGDSMRQAMDRVWGSASG